MGRPITNFTIVGGGTAGAGVADPPLPPLPDEPLAISAPLARDWARRLCGGCATFHAIWQYLRLLGIVTSPRDHAALYLESLRPLIRAGMRRVLVAGTADYGMPAAVLWAFAAESATPDLTVVDVCETPLRLCAWYADRIGAAITIERSDLLAYRAQRPFEILCTHVLFGHIAPGDRPALAARWRDLLAPGGHVVTVNRFRPDAEAAPPRDADEARRFAERIRRAAEAMPPGRLDISPEALAAMAADHIAAFHPHPVSSAEELATLFKDAGFRVECTLLGAAPEAGNAPPSERLRRGGLYVRIVAAKD